jgi:transposase
LRELKALIDIEKEDWARKMQRLLRRAARVTNRARDRGVALKPRLVERFERCYDAILAEGLAFHETQPPLAPAATTAGRKHRGRIPRRTGHNLLLRLRNCSAIARRRLAKKTHFLNKFLGLAVDGDF